MNMADQGDWRSMVPLDRAAKKKVRDKMRRVAGHDRNHAKARARRGDVPADVLSLRAAFKTDALAADPRCEWCKRALVWETATLDHVVRLRDGGAESVDNYALSCRPCNTLRNHRDNQRLSAKAQARGKAKAMRDAVADEDDMGIH